ncbi:MAG: ABC transporter permease [Defluviitaleaceae bacterium]|nr:ABC transporter permease [Defluviitaleaceae bacterium]
MLGYFVKRTLQSLLTLFIVVTAVFLMLRLMPEEGYFEATAGVDRLTIEQQEAILRAMGLRDPIHVQLGNFYRNLFRGDLGTSIIFRPHVPITEIIAERIPFSATLGLAAISISLTVGIPLGAGMALYKGKMLDRIGTFFIVIMIAVPAVIYHLLIQLYVTDWLSLPMLFNERRPESWILPILSLSIAGIASYAMWMRRFMVDELNKDYVKLARAKGQKSQKIMMFHVFRNSFVPVVQFIPASILFTIAGSIFVESLYSIPGMGGLLVQVIQRQDNPLVQALVLIYTCLGVFGMLLGDIAMAIVDPRIKFAKKGGAR